MEAEIVNENKLQIMVKQSGLEETDANILLTKFQDYFKLAAEWDIKSKTILVTDESQKTEMQMARTARLFLSKKRIDIENTRKELKESSLRRGKAIDGCANILKELIVPIEEYLEKQEKFVEIQAKAKAEVIRIEVEKKMEADRIAAEQAAIAEQIRIKEENERLKREAEAKEKALQEERRKVEAEKAEAERKAKAEQDRLKREAEAKLKEEQDKAFAEADKIRKENEAVLAKAKAEKEAVENELRIKKENEERIKREELARIETLKKADDNIKLLKLQEDINAIELPEVKSNESNSIVIKVKNMLIEAINIIQEGKQ